MSVEAYTYLHWEPGRSTLEDLKISSDMFLRSGANKFYNSGFTGTPERDFVPSRRFDAEITVSPVNTWWPYYRLLSRLRGALLRPAAVRASGGGHCRSLAPRQPVDGYAVTGLIDPERILKNVGARPGDRLILTKRLGTGVLGTALKKGVASEAEVEAAILSMCTLNLTAMEIALPLELHSATDVTGFGLLGHAREMAVGSNVSFTLDSSQIIFLPGARELAHEGHLPGGLKRNQEFLGGCVEFALRIPDEIRNLLFDPQTSGGLLFSVAAKDAGRLVEALRSSGVDAQPIGEVIEKTHPLIHVR